MKNILVFISLFSVLNIYAQDAVTIKGKIIDRDTGNGIPYSTIDIYGTDLGTSANGSGEFTLLVPTVLPDSAVFRVSALAYEKQIIPKDQFSLDQENLIRLKARTLVLPELVINSKKIKEKSIRSANLDKNSIAGHFANTGHQVAVLIENDEKVVGYISSASYYITKHGRPKAPFRVRIYNYDSLSHGPGDDILTENLIINADNKRGWFQIDLTAYELQIPANGFFVAMEWVETSPKYHYDVNIRGKLVKLYGPVLGLYSDKDVTNTWSKRFGGDWIMRNVKQEGENVKRNFRGKYSNALIGAVIKYEHK